MSVIVDGLFQEIWSYFKLPVVILATLFHDTVQHQDAPQQGVGEVVEFTVEISSHNYFFSIKTKRTKRKYSDSSDGSG